MAIRKKQGKQQFKRSIHDRPDNYPDFNSEFGHLERDTIVGDHYKSAVITLIERLSKVIITLKSSGRNTSDIEKTMINWLVKMPKNHLAGPAQKKKASSKKIIELSNNDGSIFEEYR